VAIRCRCGWILRKEISDRGRDLFYMSLESEVLGVEKLNRRALNVLAECFRTGRDEVWIVLAPDCQQRRGELSKVLVEDREELDVVGVIEKEVELNVDIARAGQQSSIQRVPLWFDQVLFGNTGAVFAAHSFTIEAVTTPFITVPSVRHQRLSSEPDSLRAA
jgi:hypothetical protein